jgi:hypothetical protein
MCNTPPQGKRKAGRSDEVVEIAGTMNDTMYFNCPSTDDVKGEIRFNHQDTIAVFSKLRMSRYSSEERIMLKPSNAFIESVDKGDGSTGTILGDEFENGKEIPLSSRKITKCSLSWHSVGGGVLSSSADG